jgi:outer membrane lipoprotein-sorting protein
VRAVTLVVTLMAIIGLPACGDDSAPADADALRELRAAAKTMGTLDSFTGTVSGESGDGTSAGKVVFQAPDRFHLVTAAGTDGEGGESILIGSTVYTSPLDDTMPGKFVKVEGPKGKSPGTNILSLFRLLEHAENVKQEGDTYAFTLGGTTKGDADVDGGFVTKLAVRYSDKTGTNTVVYRFSDFNSAPPVDPPPADLVVEQPARPACGPDGKPVPTTGGSPSELPDDFCVSIGESARP